MVTSEPNQNSYSLEIRLRETRGLWNLASVECSCGAHLNCVHLYALLIEFARSMIPPADPLPSEPLLPRPCKARTCRGNWRSLR